MRGDRDDGCRRRQPGLLGDARQQTPEHGGRLDHAGEERRGQAEPREQLLRPGAGADVEELGRARVGGLGVALAREPVDEQVGNQEQRLGGGQRPRLLEREQLEERVERQQLDAGRLVELLRRDACERLRHRVAAAAVTVVQRVRDERAVTVDEPEVAAPRVDADAAHPRAGRELGQRDAELGEEPERVPVEPARQPDRPICESARLSDGDRLAVEAPRDRAAALGAEVEGDLEVAGSGHRSLVSVATSIPSDDRL